VAGGRDGGSADVWIEGCVGTIAGGGGSGGQSGDLLPVSPKGKHNKIGSLVGREVEGQGGGTVIHCTHDVRVACIKIIEKANNSTEIWSCGCIQQRI
jgi:hypothetical protein